MSGEDSTSVANPSKPLIYLSRGTDKMKPMKIMTLMPTSLAHIQMQKNQLLKSSLAITPKFNI